MKEDPVKHKFAKMEIELLQNEIEDLKEKLKDEK